jgi:hypothetical protein
MIVTGRAVSPERALEVIRRTDNFFGWTPRGNNREFIKDVQRLTGVPDVLELAKTIPLHEALERKQKWNEKWGLVETSFVRNDWVSSNFIWGPHGWMHPDGTIEFHDNVGKWPSVEEIFDDWAKIAEAFPDLEIEATVMSEEEVADVEKEPVASFLVGGGKVELVDPLVRDIHAERGRSRDDWQKLLPRKGNVEEYVFNRLNAGLENAIPMSIIEEWATQN